LQKVLLTRLLIIHAASEASPDVAVLQVHRLKGCNRKATDSNNVLLQQPNNKDKLSVTAEEVNRGSEMGRKLGPTRQ
jgi:hypothetical protein